MLENEEVFSEKLQIEDTVLMNEKFVGYVRGKGRQRSGIPGRAFLYKVQQKMVF